MNIDHFVFKRLIPAIFSRPLFQPINQLLFRVALSGMGVNNYDGTSRDERLFLRAARKSRHVGFPRSRPDRWNSHHDGRRLASAEEPCD